MPKPTVELTEAEWMEWRRVSAEYEAWLERIDQAVLALGEE